MVDKKIYTAEEIFALNQTDQIMRSKARDIDKNFYHYTTVDSVNKILSSDGFGNHFIFVRNIATMNDLNEAELHKSDGNRIHSFCTCCTKHEKIPLWYLYSGICGNGARLGFTPGKMIKFLNSIKIVYPVENGKANYSNTLKINEDFELFCGWVYYLMDGNNRVMHKNTFYAVEEMDEETIKRSFFIKNYPWEYEREFRIIIINKTDTVFERIALTLPSELIPTLEIMSAPEYTFTEEEKKRYVSFGIKPEKIKKSKLNINMDLLRNNREHILGQMDKWCDEDHCSNVCTYVRSKKKCTHKENK